MDENQVNQPVQAQGDSMEQQMSAEMENSRLIEEQQAQMVAATAQADAREAKKDNKGLLIGLIVACVVAVCGIAFGVLMMVLRSNDAADYKGQIATLTKTNTALTEQIAAQTPATEVIDAETILKFLRETFVGAEYEIAYAKVYGIYDGAEDMEAYWVKYVTEWADGSLVEYNVIMQLGADGNWTLGEPFGVYDETEMAEYVVIDL